MESCPAVPVFDNTYSHQGSTDRGNSDAANYSLLSARLHYSLTRRARCLVRCFPARVPSVATPTNG